MTEPPDRRRDHPRRLIVSLVDRAIARLPAHSQMTGRDAVDVLLDLRRGIEVIEQLPWDDDVEARRGAAAARTAPRRRWWRRTI